ncbi:MAG: hypothetical protein IJM30_07325 [Thermoguttaceae bacterium]|nr:hypothetical protein [Thermoguttaceae bacterium]
MNKSTSRGALALAFTLCCASLLGFDGRVPIVGGAKTEPGATASENLQFAVDPFESRERATELDPALFWENWSEHESIPSADQASFARPALTPDAASQRRGSLLLEVDAIVVWNGREDEGGRELILFQTKEKPLASPAEGASDASLGILPLSGKPIRVARAGDDFVNLKNAFSRKYANKHKQDLIAPGEVYDYPERAPYCAFVVESENASALVASASQSISELFPGAKLAFGKTDEAILQSYFDAGIRHFLLDVFDYEKKDDYSYIKTPLSVVFESPKLFVPFGIEKIGAVAGSDPVVVDMLVLTPGRVKIPEGAEPPTSFDVFPNLKVDPPMALSLEELKKQAPEVAKFCEENGLTTLVVRNMLGDALESDLTFVGDPEADAGKPGAATGSSESEAKPVELGEEPVPANEAKPAATKTEAPKPSSSKAPAPKAAAKAPKTQSPKK